jgi:hypothetical protein
MTLSLVHTAFESRSVLTLVCPLFCSDYAFLFGILVCLTGHFFCHALYYKGSIVTFSLSLESTPRFCRYVPVFSYLVTREHRDSVSSTHRLYRCAPFVCLSCSVFSMSACLVLRMFSCSFCQYECCNPAHKHWDPVQGVSRFSNMPWALLVAHC